MYADKAKNIELITETIGFMNMFLAGLLMLSKLLCPNFYSQRSTKCFKAKLSSLNQIQSQLILIYLFSNEKYPFHALFMGNIRINKDQL